MTTVSLEEAELLRSTGPGTPMGELFRRVWQPILLTSDLPAPDGDPVRVKVLWEDLVAFRDSHDRVGLLDNACPHRHMPLADGLNANGRLTCRYHSWAFDVTGRCVDDQPGADSVRARAYPVIESAGIVWAYLGPPDMQPPPPAFDFCRLPADHVVATRSPARGTYLKVVGEHIDAAITYAGADNTAIEVQDTKAGYRFLARPRAGGDPTAVELARHLVPTHTVSTSPDTAVEQIAVPVDAWNSMRFTVAVRLDRPFTTAERGAFLSRGPLPTAAQSSPADSTPGTLLLARLRRRLIDAASNQLTESLPPSLE
jgi:nitrite reductase/ring-hydroxylating ferredoxin subunit